MAWRSANPAVALVAENDLDIVRIGLAGLPKTRRHLNYLAASSELCRRVVVRVDYVRHIRLVARKRHSFQAVETTPVTIPSYLSNGGEIEYFKWDPLDHGFEDMEGNFREIDTDAYFDKVDVLFDRDYCPYCQRPVFQFLHERDEENYDFDKILSEYEVEIRLCGWCYYWCYRRQIWFEFPGFSGPIHSLAISKAATFDDLQTECSRELSRYLRQRDELWHQIPPRRVEKLVADVLKVHYPAVEVIHVGKPADGGKDIILIDTDGTKSLVEVKARRTPEFVEPVTTLRNLLGAMVGGEDRALKGIVVSAGDHYSYQARKFAEGLKGTGYSIELTDRGKLARMLGPLARTDKFLDAVRFDGSNDEFDSLIRNALL